MSRYRQAVFGMGRMPTSDFIISEDDIKKYENEQAIKKAQEEMYGKMDYKKERDYDARMLDEYSKNPDIKQMKGLLPLTPEETSHQLFKSTKNMSNNDVENFTRFIERINEPRSEMNQPMSDYQIEKPVLNLNNLKTYMKLKSDYPGDTEDLRQNYYRKNGLRKDFIEINKLRKTFTPEYPTQPGVLDIG